MAAASSSPPDLLGDRQDASGAANMFMGDDHFLDPEGLGGAAATISKATDNNRDSGISVSRFNKWLVSEHKRDTGDLVRDDAQQLRSMRKDARSSHHQYGASLAAASRAQMLRDKQQYEALRRQNWQKGMQVREDLTECRGEKERLKAEWIEHGRRLRVNNTEQRKRIAESVGEGSKRITELVAQCKLEEEAFEAALAERRREVLEANRQEVQKVRAETDRGVIDAAKLYAHAQRKEAATGTKKTIELWKRERGANTAYHLKAARQNRADAQATRAKAKQLREELVQKRKKEAVLQRSKLKSSREENERLREKLVGGTKTNHDEMYHAKFVPAGSADVFSKSTYGNLVA